MGFQSNASDPKLKEAAEKIWSKYLKTGGLNFGLDDYNAIAANVKGQHNLSDKDVEELRELFTSDLTRVKKQAQILASKVMEKYGGKRDITDSMLVEYLERQFKKLDISSVPLQNAVIEEVKWALNDRYGERSNYFRFTPSGKTRISKRLGAYNPNEVTGSLIIKGDEEEKAVKKILDLHEESAALHNSVITQSILYEDFDVFNKSVTPFYADNNLFSPTPPILAALFIPKMLSVDQAMLLSSIANVVVARYSGEPIRLLPDWELFINLINDPNEAVCSRKHPLKDLLHRAEIQRVLWEAVLALRAGRFYNTVNLALLELLDTCRFYKYDAVDIQYGGDDADALRRLMMVFSWRPIIIQTLPTFNPADKGVLGLMNPYVNIQAFNGAIDSLSLVSIRLNLFNADVFKGEPPAGKESIITDGYARPHTEKVPPYDIEKLINGTEVFFDEGSDLLIPKLTRVIGSRNILGIHVHRRRYAVPVFKWETPITFKELPVYSSEIYDLDTTEIRVLPTLTIENDEAGKYKQEFRLRSVVVTKTKKLSGDKDVIIGSFTVAYDTNKDVLVYDPLVRKNTSDSNTRGYDELASGKVIKPLFTENEYLAYTGETSIQALVDKKCNVIIYEKNTEETRKSGGTIEFPSDEDEEAKKAGEADLKAKLVALKAELVEAEKVLEVAVGELDDLVAPTPAEKTAAEEKVIKERKTVTDIADEIYYVERKLGIVKGGKSHRRQLYPWL